MRLCPNCAKEISDDRKICRNCGSILEAVAEGQVTASCEPVEPPRREDADAQTAQVTRDDRVTTEDECLGGLMDMEAEESTEESPWICPQCGETVPSAFAVCWNCQALRSAQQTNSVGQETPRSAAGSASDEAVVEATLVNDTHARASSPSTQCPQCGSAKMMHGVNIRDQGQGSDGSLKVVITGNPAALMFKDRLYGTLRASICGECGHLDLRVANAAELYRHYLKSHDG